jgi:hypothetical protein
MYKCIKMSGADIKILPAPDTSKTFRQRLNAPYIIPRKIKATKSFILPSDLLVKVDSAARELGVHRNAFIIEAIEQLRADLSTEAINILTLVKEIQQISPNS